MERRCRKRNLHADSADSSKHKLAAGNPAQNWSIFSNCCEKPLTANARFFKFRLSL
jgi:hypothetical protein